MTVLIAGISRPRAIYITKVVIYQDNVLPATSVATSTGKAFFLKLVMTSSRSP